MKKKTDSELAEAIYLAKKSNHELAAAISVPTRNQAKVNIDKIAKSGKEVLIVPGKVLSLGEIDKKVKVYALRFSAVASEKLKKAGCETKKIIDALHAGEEIKGEILK